MWYVYIIQNENGDFTYIGLTNNLKHRFAEHNNKKVYSTRYHHPFKLIYYEAHCNKYDVAAREQFLKTGWGKNWIKRTLKGYFKSKKLGG